ncbi:Sugar kinase of the NBD/HSP70 family, may contain an N-terminal HTH domain [Clostridium acidisoli DSM 12555]|uniref:Sugar kinase of the NBD/HSP70 family, may contain an N-terminal HTH domain n=1 Tax=Clostridium acidisoli DSM 12555 TaxID=1121291 RepID=A0A1W1X325_9CLOT|nr:ROK family protein [Clostridium acidisoli]SMC18352.1 Sugar kinase of the NBD/HSP70 family, may contain an N-terminal HTH domain [Clostridium acidisoli DSM 12555]
MNFLVLDIGGQAIKYALMNEKTQFIEKGNVPTPADTIENFIETIGTIFDKYRDKIEGIAMSMPGRIDSDRGYLYTGGALVYNDNKEMATLVQQRCPVPITIENDGKCAALAETWLGNLKNFDDAIVIVIGTGIGGGIIKDKKLLKGKHFIAGEFSLIQTNLNDYTDKHLGMWATQSGTPALCTSVAKIKHLPQENVNGYKVFELAKSGDKEVLDVINDYCYKIALQLYNLQHIYDPEKFAIGGGISKQDILIEYIQKNIDKCADEIPYIIKPEIIRCKFYNDSNLIGALYTYLTRYNYSTDF